MIKQKLYHAFSLIQTEYIIEILYGLGFFSEIDINFLVDSSLLTINNSNQLEMHGLLRDMGREVVCELSPNHPGKHGRIWLPKDVQGVLNNQTVRIKSVCLVRSCTQTIFCLLYQLFREFTIFFSGWIIFHTIIGDTSAILNCFQLTEVVAGLALDVHFTSKSLPLSRVRYLNLLLIDEVNLTGR